MSYSNPSRSSRFNLFSNYLCFLSFSGGFSKLLQVSNWIIRPSPSHSSSSSLIYIRSSFQKTSPSCRRVALFYSNSFPSFSSRTSTREACKARECAGRRDREKQRCRAARARCLYGNGEKRPEREREREANEATSTRSIWQRVAGPCCSRSPNIGGFVSRTGLRKLFSFWLWKWALCQPLEF